MVACYEVQLDKLMRMVLSQDELDHLLLVNLDFVVRGGSRPKPCRARRGVERDGAGPPAGLHAEVAGIHAVREVREEGIFQLLLLQTEPWKCGVRAGLRVPCYGVCIVPPHQSCPCLLMCAMCVHFCT